MRQPAPGGFAMAGSKQPVRHSVEVRGVDNGYVVRHTADGGAAGYKSSERVAASPQEAMQHVASALGGSNMKMSKGGIGSANTTAKVGPKNTPAKIGPPNTSGARPSSGTAKGKGKSR